MAKQRAQTVDTGTFVRRYMEYHKAGKTREDLIEALGMNGPSFSSRLSQLNGKLEDAGKSRLPELKSESGAGGGRRLDLDAIGDFIASQLGDEGESESESENEAA